MRNTVEWRNAGETSKYPISESSDCVSDSGWTIPPGLFVDLQVCVRGEGDVFISSIASLGSGISGTVSHGSAVIGKFVSNGGSADLISDSGRRVGMIALSESPENYLSGISPVGETFSASSAKLEDSCVIRLPGNVLSSVEIAGNGYAGAIQVIEGDGVTIIAESSDTIRIDACGKPKELDECSGNKSILKSINQITPDSRGNFSIEPRFHIEPRTESDPRQILKVDAVSEGLIFYLTK